MNQDDELRRLHQFAEDQIGRATAAEAALQMTKATHTRGLTVDEAAKRLVSLRKLAHLERKELGRISASTTRKINEAIAAAEAVCVVDDARAAIKAVEENT